MDADVFGEWLRRLGHRVIRTPASYWYDQGPRVYQAFPYHWVISPPEAELRAFLLEERALGLRYSTEVAAQVGRISYHAVRPAGDYELAELSKSARYTVRRGLSHCSVAPISWESLADEGYPLHRDTLDRQGRRDDLTPESWRRRCRAAADLPGFVAWGARVGDRLAAALQTCRIEGWVSILSQQSQREYLRDGVNNALTFTVTQHYCAQPGVEGVFYGLHSLDAPSSVDAYKFHMGYQAKPVRQRVLFHPWAAPLLGTSAVHATLKRLGQSGPFAGSAALAKAEGMVRFYREGALPLEEQAADSSR